MSNRRKLRPSICRAVGTDGRLLVKQATYRDPRRLRAVASAPVRHRPAPKRNRARAGKPMSYSRRDDSYWPRLTGKQARRIFKKYRHAERKAGRNPELRPT